MDILKYQALLETLEQKSLTRAAEQMGYTQPGISHMIRSLEEEFGFPLLLRQRDGVEPTGEARQLLHHLYQIVESERSLRETVAQINGIESGIIRIGCFYSVSVNWIPQLLRQFQELHPNIAFQLSEGWQEIWDGLMDNQLDLGFLSLPVPQGLEFYPIRQDAALAVLPVDHPLASMERVHLADLVQFPFISAGDDILQLLSCENLSPTVQYRVRSDETILSMVSQGLGVSLLYQLSVQHTPFPVVLRPLERPVYRTLGVALRSLRHASPATKAFVEMTLRSGLGQ